MSRSVNLEIETDVLTTGGIAEIVTAILECLLFQRNQIDLVYSTFRSFVNGWLANEWQSAASESVHAYMINRQREKAIETKKSVSAMSKLIEDAFEQHNIKSIRFVFGSTMSTPKEVYTVHLPITAASIWHLNDHHRLNKAKLNQLLISLVTHQELNGIFSKNLGPTNIFLEFEMLQTAKNAATTTLLANVFPTVEKTQLPKSCKHIHFHLQHKKPADFQNFKMNCCRLLKVFNGERVEGEADDELQNELMTNSTWWESEIIIRGFKEKLIKGHSIWNK